MGSVDVKFKGPVTHYTEMFYSQKNLGQTLTPSRPLSDKSEEDQDGMMVGIKRSLFSLSVTHDLLSGARPEDGPETGGR